MTALVYTALHLGLLYGIAALSTVVSFRFLRFPDLTVDGSFVTGAVVVSLLIRNQVDPLTATLTASCFGFVAGACTGAWHRIFGINKFFSGIITMMMLYSVNLRILGGANVSLSGVPTIFDEVGQFTSDFAKTFEIAVAFLIASIIVCFTFLSKIGLQIRAIGSNPTGLSASTMYVTFLTIVGVGLANFLAALSGALVAQYQRFADVGMGIGVTINVFASLFLGEVLLVVVLLVISLVIRDSSQRQQPFLAGGGAVGGEVFAALVGTIGFMAILTATLYLGLRPSDTKFFGALLLLAGLVWRRGRRVSLLVPPGEFEK